MNIKYFEKTAKEVFTGERGFFKLEITSNVGSFEVELSVCSWQGKHTLKFRTWDVKKMEANSNTKRILNSYMRKHSKPASVFKSFTG